MPRFSHDTRTRVVFFIISCSWVDCFSLSRQLIFSFHLVFSREFWISYTTISRSFFTCHTYHLLLEYHIYYDIRTYDLIWDSRYAFLCYYLYTAQLTSNCKALFHQWVTGEGGDNWSSYTCIYRYIKTPHSSRPVIHITYTDPIVIVILILIFLVDHPTELFAFILWISTTSVTPFPGKKKWKLINIHDRTRRAVRRCFGILELEDVSKIFGRFWDVKERVYIRVVGLLKEEGGVQLLRNGGLRILKLKYYDVNTDS